MHSIMMIRFSHVHYSYTYTYTINTDYNHNHSCPFHYSTWSKYTTWQLKMQIELAPTTKFQHSTSKSNKPKASKVSITAFSTYNKHQIKFHQKLNSNFLQNRQKTNRGKNIQHQGSSN